MRSESMFYESVLSKTIELEYFLGKRPWLLTGIVVFLFIVSVMSDRKRNMALLIIYMLLVIYITLLCRISQSSRRVSLEIFASYKFILTNEYLRIQILENIFLFMPLGTILVCLRPKWSTILFPVLISVIIESLQLITGWGEFEIDDIISNSLGGALGCSTGLIWYFSRRAMKKALDNRN